MAENFRKISILPIDTFYASAILTQSTHFTDTTNRAKPNRHATFKITQEEMKRKHTIALTKYRMVSPTLCQLPATKVTQIEECTV